MFETLIESKHKPDKTRFLGVGSLSLTIHTAFIVAAILTTAKVGQSIPTIRSVVIARWPEDDQQAEIEAQIGSLPTIVLPTDLPTVNEIPPIELHEGLRLEDHSGSGGEAGITRGAARAGDVYEEMLVEETPSLLSAPQPPYPEVLKQAGIHGRVVIQSILDTSGRAEPNSVTILQSPDPGFDPGSRSWMLRALFRPGRVHGRTVRVLIQVPLEYRITAR